MSANVIMMREPVRAIMGDLASPTGQRKFAESGLDMVTRSVLRLGRVTGLALGDDLSTITPDPTGSQFALLTYEACLMLVAPDLGDYQYSIRAARERIGNRKDFFNHLQQLAYEIRNDETRLVTSTDFTSWVQSVSGLEIWKKLSEMDVRSPVATIGIGMSGIVVTTSRP